MQVQPGRMFIGRFTNGADLLLSLTRFCQKEQIRLGAFSAIGALTGVNLGYYDQDAKKYVNCRTLDKKLEITSCSGNISMMDGEIFVHAHICLADHQGTAYGGHLMPGSTIFAVEYCFRELCGGELERIHEPITGLRLWADLEPPG